MKKKFCLAMLCLSIQATICSDMMKEDLRIIDLVRGDTPFYKDPRVQKAAAIGATPTALIGGGLGAAIAAETQTASQINNQNPTGGAPANPSNPTPLSTGTSIGASIGGAIGGGIGGMIGTLDRIASISQRRNEINNVLMKNTNGLYKFQHLTKPQAILIYAAYRKNLPRLQRWASSQKDFLLKKGIKQTIAELFYLVSESEIYEELREWARQYDRENPRATHSEYWQARRNKEKEIRKSLQPTQDQINALYDEMMMPLENKPLYY